MPTWSWIELLLASQYHQMDETLLQTRYNFFGGNPRAIFDSALALKQNINSILQIDSLKNTIAAMESLQMESTKISHLLLHMIPQEEYTQFTLRFASVEVENILMSQWENTERDNFVTFLSNAANDPLFGTLRGQLWERLVHASIIKGGTFKVRNLKTKEEFTVDLNPTISKYLYKIQEVSLMVPNATVWLRPVISNFESVDAIIPGFGLFQITIAKKHGVKHQGLLNLFKNLQNHPYNYRLFFVLPPDQYMSFTSEQPYFTADDRVHKKVSEQVQQVTQYALCFETSPVTHPIK